MDIENSLSEKTSAAIFFLDVLGHCDTSVFDCHLEKN